ncbi:MAG: enolase C-terminal domain-like protein [Anaerobutyricum soehngenii]
MEIHRRCGISDAIALARGIEKYHPYFYEDPVNHDSFDDMEQVAKKIHIPIATGERLHTPQEFAMLIKRDAVQFVRPDRMRVRWYYRRNEDCCNGRSLWSKRLAHA